MRISKKRRAMLVEAGRKGGRSRSEAKIAAVRANGHKHVSRVKSLEELFAEEAHNFKKDHPELFEV